jgi:hypothetical protein
MAEVEERIKREARALDAHITAFAALIFLFLLVFCGCAHGHDIWIDRGNFKSPIDGSHCCGPHDCVVVPAEQVSQLGQGYYLRTFNEVVPFLEVQVSRDGNYWRCKKGDGSRRCFFAPPPST